MPKVRRCNTCGKRWRGQDGWNVEMIAGLEAGYLCPECQSAQQDLDAELNLMLGRSKTGSEIHIGPNMADDEVAQLVEGLVKAYPTPEVMRDKATRLAQARSDGTARAIVHLMRSAADQMESGDLYDDGGLDSTQCMRCGKGAPTTVDEFTNWAIFRADGEDVGLVCPDCISAEH